MPRPQQASNQTFPCPWSEQADNFFFASEEEGEEGGDDQGFWGFEGEGEGEYAAEGGDDGDEEEEDEEVVDLDEM